MDKTKILKVCGGFIILLLIIFSCMFVYDLFLNPNRGLNDSKYSQKFDSLSQSISGLRTRDTILENRFSKIVLSIRKRDSLENLDKLKTNDEINKLKKSNNHIVVAISDSILQSRKQKR